MAVTTTSAPQQQVAMPAVDLRQAIGSVVSTEGVRTAADLVVAQRGAGANMSVDVATGSAVIQDDHGSGGGFYSYTLAATTNVAVTVSDPTNPRIDRVVIRVRDQALGDAANDAVPVVVAGTPTAAATLVNLNGAAAVPGSSLLLANVLVPATSTSVTTANIDTTVKRTLGLAPVVPSVRVYNNAALTLTTATLTVITFNTERFDTDTIHDTVTNTSRLTCKTAGKYLITGTVSYAPNATGVRDTYISLNNATRIADDLRGATAGGASTRVTVSTVWDLVVGDYVELACYQDSGGNLNVESASAYTPEFSMVRVGA